MTTRGKHPQILEGCETLPPMETVKRSPTTGDQTTTKRKPDYRKTGKRFEVLNNFVDFTMRDLKGSELRTWLILYRDTKDGIARTAQADIARRAGISVRAVHGAIKSLEKRGLLNVVHRGGLNRGPSRYRVTPLVD